MTGGDPRDEAMVPPHSDEAEQSVLGCLLMDNRVFDRVSEILEVRHFYRAEYGNIFTAIRALVLACKPADVLTVSESCGADIRSLNELVMSVHSAANAHAYADIVRDRWMQRELISIGGQIVSNAQKMGDAAEKIDQAMSSLRVLNDRKKAGEPVTLAESVIEFLDRLSDEAAGKTEVISTGLRDLDNLLAGGLRRGELMVVGARPKMGKTALTLQFARNISRTHGVLVCSQEMPRSELVARNVAAMGSVNLAELRRPDKMSSEAWSAVSASVEEMRGLTMALDEQRALRLIDVRRKVMEAKRKQAVDLVVVDFLQLMAGDGDNRNQELDRISNGLKAMAGEFDVAVVLLSQLSREADKRHGPPVMTDLRDCGAIEAAADIIAMLYREFAHPLGDKGEDWKHHAQLEVVQRNGAPGNVNLWFSGEYQQFKDWSGPSPFKAAMKRASGSGARKGGLD